MSNVIFDDCGRKDLKFMKKRRGSLSTKEVQVTARTCLPNYKRERASQREHSGNQDVRFKKKKKSGVTLITFKQQGSLLL